MRGSSPNDSSPLASRALPLQSQDTEIGALPEPFASAAEVGFMEPHPSQHPIDELHLIQNPSVGEVNYVDNSASSSLPVTGMRQGNASPNAPPTSLSVQGLALGRSQP